MVLLVLLELIRLHYLLFHLTPLVSLLCILLLLNYEPTLLIYQLLLLWYSIRFSLLPILLSIPYLSHISLYQNNSKNLLLILQVIEI